VNNDGKKIPVIGIGNILIVKDNKDNDIGVRFIVCKTKKDNFLVQACDYPIMVENKRLHMAIAGFIGLLNKKKEAFCLEQRRINFNLMDDTKAYFNQLADTFLKTAKSQSIHLAKEQEAFDQLFDMLVLAHTELNLKHLLYDKRIEEE